MKRSLFAGVFLVGLIVLGSGSRQSSREFLICGIEEGVWCFMVLNDKIIKTVTVGIGGIVMIVVGLS